MMHMLLCAKELGLRLDTVKLIGLLRLFFDLWHVLLSRCHLRHCRWTDVRHLPHAKRVIECLRRLLPNLFVQGCAPLKRALSLDLLRIIILLFRHNLLLRHSDRVDLFEVAEVLELELFEPALLLGRL